MKIVQVGIGDQEITEILSKLKVLSAILDDGLENKEYGKKFSVNFYNSLDDLIDLEEFHGACVCTESNLIGTVKKLLGAKKHVFVNKPNFDWSEINELEELSKKNKVNLAFGIKQKFNPVIQTLKNMIVEQSHGELLMLEFYQESLTSENNELIFDKALSEISSSNWIFGELPIVVYARMGNFNNQKENYASIMIGYRNNKTALILLNGVSQQTNSTIRAICSKDVINSDLRSFEIEVNGVSKTISKNNSTLQQFQQFIDSIQEGSKMDFQSHELKNLIEIVEAALLSSKQGVPIYLDLK